MPFNLPGGPGPQDPRQSTVRVVPSYDPNRGTKWNIEGGGIARTYNYKKDAVSAARKAARRQNAQLKVLDTNMNATVEADHR